MGSTNPSRAPGRPRRAAVDAAIIRAAVELVAEVGAAATTLTAVADRAGVARATVYLRWPTRSALMGAVARTAVGGQPMPMTGDLEQDLRFAPAYVRQIFSNPAFRAVLPEIVRGVLTVPAELAWDSVAPRRRAFAQAYRDHAAEQGFDPSVDPDLAFDLFVGTSLAHLLANGRPMSEDEGQMLTDVILRGLRRP